MSHKPVDYKLFFTVFALIIFWMVMISSVSVYSSFRLTSIFERSGLIDQAYNHFYVLRNMSHVFIGLVALVFLVKIPYTLWEKYSKYVIGANLLLLVYVLFFGENLNGATGWINVPLLPSIQPMEFMKFSVVIFLAYFFKKYHDRINTFKEGFVPFFALVWVVVVLLGLQPDFWGILMIVPLMFILFFLAWGWMKYILTLFWLGMLLILSVYHLWSYDSSDQSTRSKLSYIHDRFNNFLSDEQDLIENRTINYQTEQALIAIGSGGFLWLGFGNSIQKFGYLPEVQWDFIFSVIIEELGFMWGFILLLLYGYIWYRWYYISYYSQDLFAKIASFWVTSWILIQASINIWVNLNMMPLTWVTLPFISYGWSSLLALMLGLGLLLNISRHIDPSKWWKFLQSKQTNHSFWERKTFMY